jgi:UDP-N-acetylmuramoyl-L-alanyl-D-glutamate--2,6-diaminopimelate ligase
MMNQQVFNHTPKTLGAILHSCLDISPEYDVVISGITLDSRQVRGGDVYLAMPGEKTDGRLFIDQALEKKASAVLVDAGPAWQHAYLNKGVPVIPVEELRNKAGSIAAKFYDQPAKKLRLIGITGTNGKTSCSQFLAQALENLGHRCGVCGTLGYGLIDSLKSVDENVPGTTPDAVTIQKILSELTLEKCKFISLEVSSHALDQRRINPAEFELAMFTNLSRDHLDYHGTMENYGAAKRRLFTSPALKLAVINQDDQYSSQILNALAAGVETMTYSLESPAASVFAKDIYYGPNGCSATIVTPWGNAELTTPLLGKFNMSNVLGVLTALLALFKKSDNFDYRQILSSVAAIKPVSGRMETLNIGDLTVVVDYAHTPDALKSALLAIRQHHANHSIWCVFGCGGNRDRGKRPLMAEIAEQLANRIIVTDDNPRTENAGDIIQQIMLGFSSTVSASVINDRAAAIEFAVMNAAPGDVVLIAGKGHENYQDVGGNRMAFSDQEQAIFSLNKRLKIRGSL